MSSFNKRVDLGMQNIPVTIAAMLFVGMMSACKTAKSSRGPIPKATAGTVVFQETGLGFTLADRMQGLPTVSGESYDTSKLTVAHRTLKFGTRITVLNAATGASVVVRVNDRSLPGKSIIVGLSKAAARKLGVLGKQVFAVQLKYNTQ